MNGRPAAAQHLRDLTRLRRVRDRIAARSTLTGEHLAADVGT